MLKLQKGTHEEKRVPTMTSGVVPNSIIVVWVVVSILLLDLHQALSAGRQMNAPLTSIFMAYITSVWSVPELE